MSITLSALQQQRRDTAANWTSANPTLLAGEIGIESDTGYWKVGNGSTVWTGLTYLNLAGTIAVNKGGTGQTSYTNGQLLIGNTTGNTLTKSTLTAGSGVTITNGNGSISISATGSGGTVTSVSGTAPISVATGTTTPAISVSSASTSAAGVVQLSNSTSTTSSVLAATSTAVKSAYDLANAAVVRAGDTMTGALAHPLGAAATPSITFAGDLNTGIYSPSADQVAITTGGTGRFFVDSTGLVGVGTSAPSDLFSIGTLGTTTDTTLTIGSSASSYGSIYFGDGVGTARYRGYIQYNHANDSLIFGTSASDAVRIDSSGRVGIGTSVPATTLDLNGAYAGNITAVAALDLNLSTANFFTKTINANSTFTVSNTPASRAFAFTLELTHTSGTVTWFSGVEWPSGTAPTLTTGKTHLFMFVTDDGGTRWRASSLINYTN
jgi:hypothetical protein